MLLPGKLLYKYEIIKFRRKRQIFYNLGRYSYSLSPELIKPDTRIGNFVSIAGNVQIGPGNHPTSFLTTSPFTHHFRAVHELNTAVKEKTDELTNKIPVNIGNDVWIGANVVIMNGINIGTGAVIGANSVVTHDVAPYEVVGGVPAKNIKYRFDAETIKKILETRWWRFPDDILLDLPLHDVQKALEIITTRRNYIKETCKICFIITSCIYPYHKPLNHTETRSVFTDQERLTQTKKTIHSIRKKCPKAKILLIDNGDTNPMAEILNLVDEFMYIGGTKLSRLISSARNKSVGEAYMLLKATKYLAYHYDLIFKISGRYFLTYDFDIFNFDKNAFNFLNYYKGKVITGNGHYIYGSHSTRLYSFPGYKLGIYRKCLKKTFLKCLTGESIEIALAKTLQSERIFYHQSLGLAGKIAVDGSIITE